MSVLKVAGLALASLIVLSAQERAGNQSFRIPQGWTRTDQPGSTVLSPTAEPKNTVALLLTGHPLQDDFRQTFDRDVKRLNGDLRLVKAGEVQSRRTPDGIDLLALTVELQSSSGGRTVRYYLAANPSGRLEMALYMTTPALFQRYWPAMQQFVSTWSFATRNTSPATTPPPPADPGPIGTTASNRLDGVYIGYKYNYVTVLGVVQKKAVNDYFSFFPDGTVYWGLPQTGLAGFNLARACQGGRQDFCGTYQLNGEQITILLNNGTYKQAGSVMGSKIQLADRPYTLAGDPAKSAAHTLEGDFGRADAMPGEDLARRFIRFTRDGQFVDQGIVNVVTSSDISTGSPRFERQSGSGTYKLAPYTLILRYSDGYQRQLGVTIQPSDMEKPALQQLFVNTYTLVRRR